MTHPSPVRPKAQSTSRPTTMRAAAIDRFGGPEVLTLHEIPVPNIEPDEVLIALQASGVGSWDAEIRAGWSPSGRPPKFPLVLGTDGAGRVAAAGSRVRRLKEGDAVYSYSWDNPKGGFYAEYVAVAAERVGHAPKSLGLEQAGGVPTVGLTALQGIENVLHLKKGERLLIHGASGGVGCCAIQFARGQGGQVFATAAGEDGVALASQLGAEEAVDGKRQDLVEAVRHFAGKGFDAIFATVGQGLSDLLATLRAGGRVAYPNGIEPEPEKKLGIKILSYDAVSSVREFERLNRAIEAVRFSLPISATFPLEDAALAHQRLEGHNLGKIVLRITD